MSRAACRLIIVAACVIAAGCALRGVAPNVRGPAQPSYYNATPFLSTKNYVVTYPVAHAGIDIAKGSDKNLWFTTGGFVAKVTPTGTETYFTNPQGLANRIAPGLPGFLWFSDGTSYISKISTSGTITAYFVSTLTKTFGVAPGPDGNEWYTDQGTHSIGKVSPTGTSSLISIPSGATPVGITAGPDGNMWFSASGGPTGQEFGKVVIATKMVTEYPIASGTAGAPGVMTKGPDGNIYAANSNGGVFRVTTAGVSTYFPTSFTSSFENGIAVGPDKQIWVSPGDSADDLTEFNTTTHKFGKAAMVPNCGASSPGIPRGLTLGPDGDMWFVTENCAYVGVYEEKLAAVGIRLNGESSTTDPTYGFELGYFLGTTSTTSQTLALPAGESVQFTNVDASFTHTASFLGDASSTGAPWPASFNGSAAQSAAGTAIGTTGFSTGPLSPGQSSFIYETGMPGFYMFGCAFHYNPDSMRTVAVVK